MSAPARGRGLLGRLASPEPQRRLAPVDAVVLNVASILNTHVGDGFTCPEMGCDFVGLMSRWPTSESDVLAAVRRTVEQYEPRLRQVQVRRVHDDGVVVALEITGELRASGARDRIRLRTELAHNGHMDIV
ncbi:MAG: type VI secretion system baseplate subunit TssE [Deltaproteobacteria bacterium]|nr:type VI secretion system baseplate subunit TssE [Deltaproteobacteria bacterium]